MKATLFLLLPALLLASCGEWNQIGANSFYEANLLTLEGQTLAGDVTAADRFANVLEANEEKISEGKYDEIDTESYGEKFFFVVWKEDCTACETAESGLRYLSDNWGYYDLIPAISGESFKMYTIDASQVSANDDKEYTDMGTAPSAFNRWTIAHINFFQQLNTDWDWKNSNYKVNESIGDDDYLKFFVDTDSDDPTTALGAFPVPSICLVDYTQEAIDQGVAGLREVVFSVTGDTDQQRASFLMNMWNHTETPSASNPFTDYRN